MGQAKDDIVVRRMELQDVAAAAQLELESFTVPWSEAIIKSGLQGALDHCYVLECAGIVCGYGVMRIIFEEGELLRIAIASSVRGRGLSKPLMDAMLAKAAGMGVTAVTLEVRESNAAARGLYKSYGFVEESVRKGYYSLPAEDAVIMWKREGLTHKQ